MFKGSEPPPSPSEGLCPWGGNKGAILRDIPGKPVLGCTEAPPYFYFTAISSKGLAIVALRSPP